MLNEELTEISKKFYMKNFPADILEIIKKTYPWIMTSQEAKQCIKFDLKSQPRCSVCGEFSSFNGSYKQTCSKVCNSIHLKRKRQQFYLENYGVDHNFKIPSQLAKKKETMINKYGVENPFQSAEFKSKAKTTKLERYGDENFNNRSKAKETFNEKYQADSYIESNEFKSKAKTTKLERYGDENFNNRSKAKETLFLKHGVFHQSQVLEIFETQQKYRWYQIQTETGKVFKVQGYERFVIPKLIKEYGEENVSTDRKSFPTIFYQLNETRHRYYPDCQLSDGTIIEIKSIWTLKLWKLKYRAIFDTLLDMNLPFKVYLSDGNGECIIFNSANEIDLYFQTVLKQ